MRDATSGLNGLNRLAEGIRELCSSHVLEEKWLLAPSYRVAFQWLERVALSGQPAVNVRLKTVPSLALELASPRMAAEGLSPLRRLGLELLVYELLRRDRQITGYLSRLRASPGLAKAVSRSLLDLRLAGLSAKDLRARDFEASDKGKELIHLLRAYEEETRKRGLADYAETLRLAEESLRDGTAPLPGDVLIALPADMEKGLWGRESSFVDALPRERLQPLPVDDPEGEREGESDASLLRYIRRPTEAPSPGGDGTVEFFRALGEANEVREVLRHCLERGIPFDEVEILHTDGETYVPLIYEICTLLVPEAGGAPPVTFAEGIPLRYSRPGRALAGWMQWIREGFPQTALARLVEDGLLRLEGMDEAGWSFSRLAALLRTLPIGSGRERFREAFAAALRACEEGDGDGEEGDEERGARRKSRSQGLTILRDFCLELLDALPDDLEDASGMLCAIKDLLRARVRCGNELDEYARKRLLDMESEIASIAHETSLRGSAVISWVEEQTTTEVVEGKGPRPGCLFVAPLLSGGHSGRPHTFILGLDDGRFPGSVLQDPLLLDGERKKLSESLPTSSQNMEAKSEGLSLLMARLRGEVTLSYSSRNLAEDRETLPSPALVSAYRILSGKRDATLEDLLSSLPPPASFAPTSGRGFLTMSEWWLHRLCECGPVAGAEGAVAAAFPHLGRGAEARRARESDKFTEYDGYVPEAGKDLDPTAEDGPVLSPRRLEVLGKCPMEYFFAHVLGISPPEEFTYEPHAWLDAMEKGSLLHRVFHAFYRALKEKGESPSFKGHRELLEKILEEEIEEMKARKPPPNPQAFAEGREELLAAGVVFLKEEEAFRDERAPLYFEVDVGSQREGGDPASLPEPVSVALPGGGQVRVRGVIDRIDMLTGGDRERFLVIDYKTGSAKKYREKGPFHGGRFVQNCLYLPLAEACLKRCYQDPEIAGFEYYFPSAREHGERVAWDARELEEGREVTADLCRLLAAGCFPSSDDPEDVKYSDYRLAFVDAERCVEQLREKLANPENTVLVPFRELRERKGGEAR